MPRKVLCGLIQCHTPPFEEDTPVGKIRDDAIEKHLPLIEEAGKTGVKILCLQELFYGPYFCAEQNPKWYDLAEKIPEGPTTKLMMEIAKKHGMAIIVPIYEEKITGVYYNTAAVINNDGKYMGKYRKMHLPHVHPGFWEKFYFKPGNLDYPIFKTEYADIGVYICYDRHFPEGARLLGLNGAEIIFNPSATVAGLSEYLWELEQPAH
ncbi:MAG: acyltransferase, partial [candidate division Zixibacteria bacterium]|nr:acyltransferase [candidate division Zixibacteria bacterium]